MATTHTFADFIARIRAGDAQAAEELVQQYESSIRIIVRAHLGRAMRTQLDSVDICQSVLGTFFARAALGEYDLNEPQELLALLVRIARNKLNSQARYRQRLRRDVRRDVGSEGLEIRVGRDAPADRILEAQEVLQQLRARLTDEERELVERRLAGDDWATIASAVGGSAEGRRKQLARALDRHAVALGLVEIDDG